MTTKLISRKPNNTKYNRELIQIAAVALAAVQNDEWGSTDLSTREHLQTLENLLSCVKHERGFQENKWGPQNHSREKWMTILMEEVGEAAKEILEASPSAEAKKGELK